MSLFRIALTRLLATVLLQFANAREFRRAIIIPGPKLEAVGSVANLPALPGKALSDERIPIPREHVHRALQQIMDEWGKPGLREKLSTHFLESDRLNDAIRSAAPRNARIRVQSVANIQVNEQAIRRGQAPDGRDLLISRVTTTARTQIEFNDAITQAFVSLDGTNDYVMQIFHAIELEESQ